MISYIQFSLIICLCSDNDKIVEAKAQFAAQRKKYLTVLCKLLFLIGKHAKCDYQVCFNFTQFLIQVECMT